MNRKPFKGRALFAASSSMDRVAIGKSSLALSLACCLALTAAEARALALGELVVHSRLGQPLAAQLAVTNSPGEVVEESCIALAKPARASENQIPLLTKAKFSVEATDTGQLVRISTLSAISEPAIKLVLQLNCDSQTNVSREFTVLLDPPDFGPRDTSEEMQATSDFKAKAVADAATTEPKSVAAATNPNLTGPSPTTRGTVGPAKARKSHVPGIARKSLQQERSRPNEFRLKLSTGAIDLSASSKMTDAERLQLREKQLLLEADDQVANILALKNRVQQLEAQLAAMNLKLSTKVAPSVPDLANRADGKPPGNAEQPAERPSGKLLFWLSLAVLFPLLVLFIVVRNRKRLRESEIQQEMERGYGQHIEAATSPVGTPKPTDVAVARPALTAMEGHQKPVTEEVYYDPNSIFNPPDEKITLTEVDSVVEEADLYMIYGWTQKAIELLLHHVEKSPAEVQPWMMLFDIYHSQGLKDGFEKLAKRFHLSFDNPELWETVQALGRKLDPANGLYACATGSTMLDNPEADARQTDEEPLDSLKHKGDHG